MIEKRRRSGCTLKSFLLPIGVVCASFLPIPEAIAKIVRVSQTGDGTDGTTWGTAFESIAEAITASTTGDQIWVANGRYFEPVSLKAGIELYGGFVGNESDEEFVLRDWLLHETIIDATGTEDEVVEGAKDCVLDGWSLENSRRAGTHSGGVNCIQRGPMIIRNCKIRNHRLTCIPGVAACGTGAAIAISDTHVIVENCLIQNNFAFSGGGIFITDFDVPRTDTSVIIANCFFDGNWNGALRVFDPVGGIPVTVENCTFGLDNPGVSECRNTPDVCFVGNISPFFSLVNCIMRSPIHPNISVFNSNVVGATGNGNIDEDPQWVDPENGDYRLKPSSPCIDSGTVTTAVTDLDGNPRPVDVVGVGRDGPGAFDMGCYEFQLSPADLTRNGWVNAEDLLLFQEQWMQEGN